MIERMTHVAVVAESGQCEAVLKWLYDARNFHVMPMAEEDDGWAERFKFLPEPSPEIEATLNRLRLVLNFCQEHRVKKPGFLDTMLPLKTVAPAQEIADATAQADSEKLAKTAVMLRERIDSAAEEVNQLNRRKIQLERFSFLGDMLPSIPTLKHIAFVVVSVTGQAGKAFLRDDRVGKVVVAEEVLAEGASTYYALATAWDDNETLKELIDDHGLIVETIPEARKGVQAELGEVARLMESSVATLAKAKADAESFSTEWLRRVELSCGSWESELTLAKRQTLMAGSAHLFVARGYMKTEELDAANARLGKDIPGTGLMSCPAPEGEDPPVSLKWNKWIQPASLLLKMYGLPVYNSIDPTPFVATVFFFFVGMCLGDMLYGIGLVFLMMWLKRRYADQAHLQDFFQVFMYCGFAAIIFGLCTGSFAGNLPSMIPALKPLDNVLSAVRLIDPIEQAQTALYIAIGIGIFTQFYGLALRIYRDLRRGDKMGAFSDGFLWMCFFGFLMLTAATSGALRTLCIVLLLLTTVGLILTQGRDQSSWTMRIIVGFISLYGIVGAYGMSAFLGDVISYARLMALALTGAALGSTFNMLAKIGTEVAYVGMIIAVLMVIGGHLLNFALSLLGAFVHSARLVMLEFFGRFYDAGGYAYQPYGFRSELIDQTETAGQD